MKPPPFAYHAPDSLEAALAVLAEVGSDGKVLAGGQSLIPLLNMRLAAPAHLVDINRIDALDTIDVSETGVRVGARVRHSRLEADDAADRANPLLRQALRHVAHPVIRNRGTVVGSIVHADPAGELPAVVALLDGTVHIRRAERTRAVVGGDFFVAPLESDVEPGELVIAVDVPNPPAGAGTAFEELARRHGDFAMAGVATLVTMADGHVDTARAACIGVGPVPITVDLTDACNGVDASHPDWAEAVEQAREAIEPEDDIHATADYRRHLAGILLARGLSNAAARATAPVAA